MRVFSSKRLREELVNFRICRVSIILLLEEVTDERLSKPRIKGELGIRVAGGHHYNPRLEC